jgi:DHA1 family multidrug resistance protein-like MFS transporter
LYVREILHGQGNVTLVSGVIAALPGVATLLAAPQFGRLGDRIGSDKILKIGLACAILLYLPMAAVQNIWQLAILRFLVGITDACLVPSVQSLLAKYSPSESAGMVFSYNQSFQSIGNVMGPFIGSTVSSLMGYRQVFISTSVLVLINFLLVRKNTTELNHTHGDL